MSYGAVLRRQYHAILYRKYITLTRKWTTLVGCLLLVAMFAIFILLIDILFKSLGDTVTIPLSFKEWEVPENGIVWIDGQDQWNLRSSIASLYQEEMGQSLAFQEVASREAFDNWLLSDERKYVNLGIGFDTINPAAGNYFTMYYNMTRSQSAAVGEYLLTSIMAKKAYGDDAKFTGTVNYLKRYKMASAFSYVSPTLISFGLLPLIPLIIIQPISDIAGSIRRFMKSCELRLSAYWLGSFVFDLVVWIGAITVFWLILFAMSGRITSFQDNLFNLWYSLAMSGPAFILFLYCLNFCFSNSQWAVGQIFLIMIILGLIPVMISALVDDLPMEIEWLWALVPPLQAQRMLQYMLIFSGYMKQNLSYYFKFGYTQPSLVMQIVGIPMWTLILWLIEYGGDKIRKRYARKSFGKYQAFFQEQRQLRAITEETVAMETDVQTRTNFAIRVHDVSRLFFNTAGQPIAAVNNVSLGVDEGSTFGFLGANGAGKTTLIQMITGQLPISFGEIQVMGTSSDDLTEPVVSICPQFNDHLFPELTPFEHFVFYSKLFSRDCEQEKIDDLIRNLDFEATKDVPISRLSEGDSRKLAIALAFLGPATIILLDEPTATLDQESKLRVYDLLERNKGRKTFMLCTHLLAEAEMLCDKISIMMRGSVYTVGTPQYLSSRFGTEFKIDIMLVNESDEIAEKCTEFMRQNVPEAVLSIQRPRTRIYSVPSSLISLPALFDRMESSTEDTSGIAYYTCSSSSLERVFMEIVKMSEVDNEVSQQP